MTRLWPVIRSRFSAHSRSMRVGDGSGEAGMGADGLRESRFRSQFGAVIGEAPRRRNEASLAPQSVKRQHQRILGRRAGALVVALAPPDLLEAEPLVEHQSAAILLGPTSRKSRRTSAFLAARASASTSRRAMPWRWLSLRTPSVRISASSAASWPTNEAGGLRRRCRPGPGTRSSPDGSSSRRKPSASQALLEQPGVQLGKLLGVLGRRPRGC